MLPQCPLGRGACRVRGYCWGKETGVGQPLLVFPGVRGHRGCFLSWPGEGPCDLRPLRDLTSGDKGPLSTRAINMTHLSGASGKGQAWERGREEAHPCRKVRLSYDGVQLQHCRWGGALTWAAPGLPLDPGRTGEPKTHCPTQPFDGSREGKGLPWPPAAQTPQAPSIAEICRPQPWSSAPSKPVSVVIRWTGPRGTSSAGLSSPWCPLLPMSPPWGDLPDWSEDWMLWEKLRPLGLHMSV